MPNEPTAAAFAKSRRETRDSMTSAPYLVRAAPLHTRSPAHDISRAQADALTRFVQKSDDGVVSPRDWGRRRAISDDSFLRVFRATRRKNENGPDMSVEAVLQGAYWVAGDLRTYALGSDSDARATVTVRGCMLSLLSGG